MEQTTMKFAIVRDGGFVAYCPERQIAAYAYPTSAYAEMALRRPREDLRRRCLPQQRANWIGSPEALAEYRNRQVAKLCEVNAL